MASFCHVFTYSEPNFRTIDDHYVIAEMGDRVRRDGGNYYVVARAVVKLGQLNGSCATAERQLICIEWRLVAGLRITTPTTPYS